MSQEQILRNSSGDMNSLPCLIRHGRHLPQLLFRCQHHPCLPHPSKRHFQSHHESRHESHHESHHVPLDLSDLLDVLEPVVFAVLFVK